MAEVLAAVSGIAGLLSLTIEVFKISKAYIEGVHNASKSVTAALQELALLKKVLWELDELSGSESLKSRGNASFEDVQGFEGILKELRDKLLQRVSGNQISVKIKTLTWPFSEKKTKELVEKLHRHLQIFQFSVEIRTNIVVQDGQKDLKDFKRDREAENFQNILNWLSNSNEQQTQDAVAAKCCEGAGSWLLQHETYQKWKSGQAKSILWCPGDPGTGKTVLASIIIEDIAALSGRTSDGLAFIYSDYKSSSSQTAAELLAILSKQLAASKDQPTKELTDLAAALRGESRRPNLQQCKSLLQSLCQGFNRVFLVIDALDELQKNERELLLSSLLDLNETSVSILATSRPNCVDIQRSLQGALQLPIRAANADIRLYIHHRIEQNEDFARRIRFFETDLVTSVADSAAGMFLFAVLQLNKLANLRTPRKIQQAIQSIPTKFHERLAELYDNSFERIKGQEEEDANLGIRILQWLTYTKRPMKVAELCHALAVEWDEGDDPPTELDEKNLLEEGDLTDVCAGLVIVDKQSSVISLVHFTTQEYLNERFKDSCSQATIQISRTCLAYLQFRDLAHGHAGSDNEFEDRCRRFPFLYYAAFAFELHLQGELEIELEAEALRLLHDNKRVSGIIQLLYMDDLRFFHRGYSQNFPHDVTGLHMTSLIGLAHLNCKLLEAGADTCQKDSRRRVALHYASGGGHLQIINQTHRGVLEARDNHGKSPLHYATQTGQMAAVRILLDLGASIESVDGGCTAMQLAARWGYKDLIDLFIRKGANLETKTRHSTTALHVAAENGEVACVETLLLAGAKVEARDKSGRTPFHLATSRGSHLATAKALLANGANIHQMSYEPGYDERWTSRAALHMVAMNGDIRMSEFLLVKGADVDQKDSDGMTALQHAALVGQELLVQLLLSFGASLSSVDRYGRSVFDLAELWPVTEVLLSALQLEPQQQNINDESASADFSRFKELRSKPLRAPPLPVPFLTQHSLRKQAQEATIRVNSPDGLYALKHKLHWAAWMGDTALVQSLLDEGADSNGADPYQATPLHFASIRGRAEVVSILLANGANANHTATSCTTALAYASFNTHLDVMRILLAQPSVDVNTDVDSYALLQGAAYYGRSSALRLLTHAGADTRVLDENGNTALIWAATKGHLDCVRMLLDVDPDGDIDLKNNAGENALHYAANNGHGSVVNMLLHHGADSTIKNGNGLIARNLAETGRHKELFNLL